MIWTQKTILILILLFLISATWWISKNQEWDRMTVTRARYHINLQEHLSLHDKLTASATQSTRGSVNSSTVSVIILAQYRTGSTFIGQLFNVNPEMFYIFEPLKAVDNLEDINEQLQSYENTTVKLLERILRCEFSEQFASSFLNFDTGVRLTKNLSLVRVNADTKFNSQAQMLKEMCLSYRGNVATKTIRATLKDVVQFLEYTDYHKNVKIIHYVRDPRGVANSRRIVSSGRNAVMAFEKYLWGKLEVRPHLKSLNIDQKGSINEYCDRLHDDIQLALLQPNVLKNRYKLIRYEDFSANPKRIAEEIYSFLGLQTPEIAIEWLNFNTKVSYQDYNNMGLSKNSIKAASNWRRYLNNEELQLVQALCADVMELLGYKPLANKKFLLNFTVPSLGFSTLGRDITIQ
ncbi:carbohydrate sulfotransferase 1-like [Amphiura filiformis]|uniref:carbohydrate sulfotransferase 1-like n=1 Tax=Amphiura filiformis TaxID=82378 RepID=UPI003B20C6E5